MASKLKYSSMKFVIGLPNFFIKYATNKNLADLLIAPANKKSGNWIPKAPALIVKSLNGIGVKPAVKMIMKLYCSYSVLIFEKAF